MKIAKIQTSGRSGVEQAAIKAAQKAGIPVVGWRPKDSEEAAPKILETPSTKEEQSIIWNVRDSHASFILDPYEDSKACDLALEVADSYGRSYIVSDEVEDVIYWLNRLEEEITLYVTGPKEREHAGITKEATDMFTDIFNTFNAQAVEV